MRSPSEASLPLPMVGEGSHVRVVGFSGSQRNARRLAEMGLHPGVILTVLRDTGGSLLVAVGDTRLALSYGMAQAVLVCPLEREIHE
ncbi:MAG: ferrous iron transport protein A [Candidatus Viridilinea halotolerans]|uniref:Ferrous iron transport protein A n=1 Tax=Candidatus Viridilinea halotolerans TaxID=2491704 RepID=A0A426TQH0_9CHLR|nr:MAG: ferrous iron transport protein A [Candidatus Viridilinea halotolerans]